MGIHIRIIVTCLMVTGLCWLISAHDTIPVKLWPLTNYTGGREIVKGGGDVATFELEQYEEGEPTLGYKALTLNRNGVTVTLREDIKYKFMLMAMLYINPRSESQIFVYQYNSVQIFKVYLGDCRLSIQGTAELIHEDMTEEDCVNMYQWYTVAIRWNGDMKVAMVHAKPNEVKGDAVLEADVKDAFNFEWFVYPGNLTVGPIDKGRVCCLRVYNEEFDKGHVEQQMYEDCTEKEFWKTEAPNPCRDSPCQSGGTCLLNGTSYICLCRPWFTGSNCSTELWVTKHGFKLVGDTDLTGILDPMAGLANISARNVLECSGLCLRENLCMSFTFGLQRCTLYNDIALDFNQGPTHYFIERQINTDSIG